MKNTKKNHLLYAPGAAGALPEELCDRRSLALFAGGLFLLVTLTAQESVTMLCILLALGTLLTAALLRKRPIAPRLGLLFLAVTLYVLWAGISCFRSPYPVLALKEFTKILAGFLLFLLIIFTAGSGKNAGRNAISAVSAVSALFSFLSIDLVSTHWFSGAFRAIVETFTQDYSVNSGLETGTRINSLLADGNTFASVTGLGVLLALGLALSSHGRERAFHAVCLFLSALGFVLAFSLGAMGFIAAAFVLFLLAVPKGEKLPGVILMVETLAVTMLGVLAVYISVFDGTKQFSPIPLLAALFGSAGLAALDRLLSRRICTALSHHRALSLGAAGGLVLCGAVYGVLAFQLTGPAALAPGEVLTRAADLSAGAYTLSTESNGDASVRVTCQNETDLILHTSTVLYDGVSDGAAFTVPEGTEAVWFAVSLPEGGTVEQLSYTGTEDGSLKLHYRLLPGFMANRLQGLWANQNSVQRTEFWRDGLRIWEKSPLLGEGLGAVEAGLYSVARFEYQSRYVHNHYIQTLADAGVIGLALFAGVLVSSFWTALAGRKRGAPLAPALFAATGFAALQAVNQAAFSLSSFLSLMFCIWAGIAVHCTQAAPEQAKVPAMEPTVAAETKTKKTTAKPNTGNMQPSPAKGWTAHKALLLSALAITTIWSGLLLNHLRADNDMMFGQGTVFQRLDSAIGSDPFSRQDSMQAYIYYSAQSDDEAIQNQAGLYASAYTRPGNTDPDYLAEYFFENHIPQSAFAALSRHLAFNRARTGAWQYGLTLLAEQDDGTPEFQELSLGIAAQLQEANDYLLQPITLYGRAQTYLDSLK
ncbi:MULTISPECIES: O-antigen ligase family protein [unclassified Oscillibacter]|uniref:O-antigen ligase family protein n=1 Tax=unclassified Oscillibacter TaxID=2629304 RepID=UPI0025EF8D1B|nr:MULTISPECIES: O-antigen ligase family protein [unclassified Oscillibacter]